ncbi:MAG: hypothetical protein ABL949_04310 [Fimbriimonadaceae bacterium]
MRIVSSSAIAFAAIIALGCGSGNSVSQTSAPAKPKLKLTGMQAQESGVDGKWIGKIDMPKGKSDDPSAKLGEALVGLFVDIELEIKDGKYTLSMMGLPMQGDLKVDGTALTFQPKSVMGMTLEEAAKLAESQGKPKAKDMDKPMHGIISADGTRITIQGDASGSQSGLMVFNRAKTTPVSEMKSTVSSSETSVVGSYKGNVDASKADPKEAKMLQMMQGSLKLSLNPDNTFELQIMMKMKGTWKVVGDEVIMKVTEVMGMKDMKSNDVPMIMKINGNTLIPADKNAKATPFTFVKE